MEQWMNIIIRPLVLDDEPFLWHMLYYAARMQEDGATSPEEAKTNPDLNKYVEGWGQPTDMGQLALHPEKQQPVGAAWLRLLTGEKKTISYIDDYTPELAIGLLPDYRGEGIGTQLLTHLLAAASKVYPAIVLSVRTTNPARYLYERMGFTVTEPVINRVGSDSVNMLLRF
jgi:ribosomal protein S18 acetylase RimI-like enzyme